MKADNYEKNGQRDRLTSMTSPVKLLLDKAC